MKRLSYNIATRDGLMSVTGWTTGTPGLATHKNELGTWSITHLASGLTVCPARWSPTRKAAAEAIQRLGFATVDWTLNGEELKPFITAAEVKDIVLHGKYAERVAPSFITAAS